MKDPQRVSNLRKFTDNYDWSGSEFPVSIKDIEKFENRNNISVNVLAVEDRDIYKEDKNSIPQCIGQSHITTAFSNMAPFPSRTRVRQTCADVKIYQTL